MSCADVQVQMCKCVCLERHTRMYGADVGSDVYERMYGDICMYVWFGCVDAHVYRI